MLLKNYLFHRVSNEKDYQWPPMKPAMFDTIIRQLTQKCKVVLLEELLADAGAYNNSSDKFVTISFDDGYKDNIEFAASILEKYNCPASFYIVTNSIDTNTPTWTYVVDHIISHTRKDRIVFPSDNAPMELKEIKLLPEKKLSQSVRKIKPWLKSLSNQELNTMIRNIISQCNDVTLPVGMMMSWNDIRELKAGGFYIGSHSHTHPMLASLESEDEIKDELVISAKRVKEETGTAPLTISYPVGNYDERVIRMAKECGYKWGLAVEHEFFRYNPKLLFSIPRIELYDEPMWKAQLRIAGIISNVKKIWK